MDNPFDQFDAHPQAANPFDQFDSTDAGLQINPQTGLDKFGRTPQQRQAILDRANADDAQAQALGNTKPQSQGFIPDFAVGAIHHLGNIPVGAAQLGIHAANALTGDNIGALNQAATNIDQYASNREQQYQQVVPDSAGIDTGAVVGSVAPYLIGGVPGLLEKAGTGVASLLPEATPAILKTAASGATQGAIASGVQPVTSGDFGSGKATQLEIGAGTGGLIPVAGAAARNVYQLGQHVLAPGAVASNELGRILQATPETVDKLQNAPQFVPGEQPTTAQVIATPQAVAAEKALLNNPAYKAQYDQQANANNAARLNVLQNHAGDEQTLQAAIDARKAAAQPFIQQNLSGGNPVSAAPVLQQLKTLMLGPLGTNPTIQKGAQAIAQDIASRVDDNGMIDAGLLDGIRQNANDFLAQHAPNGAVGTREQAALGPVKDQIVSTIDGSVPGYSDYLASYARNSVPINTMETTQRILAPTDSAGLNSAGAPQLTLGRLNAGLRKADGQRYGLSPEAETDAQNVRQSLQRESISNSIRTPGSDTAYNLQAQGALNRNLFGPTLGGPTGKTRIGAAALGTMIGAHSGGMEGAALGGGLGLGLNKAAQFLNQRIMDRYAKGLLNPQEGARMVQQFLKANKSSAPKLLAQYPQWKSLLLGMPQAMTPKPPAQ